MYGSEQVRDHLGKPIPWSLNTFVQFLLFMVVIVVSEGFLVHSAVRYTSLNAQNITMRLRNDVRYEYKEKADIRWAVDKLQIEVTF